jgi:hypothetical protein
MWTVLLIVVCAVTFLLLSALAAETIREFRRMDRDPKDFTGSDRLAGSAE